MGQPKLLMPWGDSTVIEHVLAAWRASRVERVFVVVHPEDHRLAEMCAAAGADVVQPAEPPAEMKDSVRYGLDRVASLGPGPRDAWLVAPADMPQLSTATIDRVIGAYEAACSTAGVPPGVWAPRHRARHGHPVLFPWPLAAEVSRLAPDEGLNALVARSPVQYVDVDEQQVPEDFDTPEDYQRLRRGFDG